MKCQFNDSHDYEVCIHGIFEQKLTQAHVVECLGLKINEFWLLNRRCWKSNVSFKKNLFFFLISLYWTNIWVKVIPVDASLTGGSLSCRTRLLTIASNQVLVPSDGGAVISGMTITSETGIRNSLNNCFMLVKSMFDIKSIKCNHNIFFTLT